MTDEARVYIHLDKVFKSHSTVNHSLGEYVRGNVHTNTVEGFYSVFKRGMKGAAAVFGSLYLYLYFHPAFAIPFLVFGAALKTWALQGQPIKMSLGVY